MLNAEDSLVSSLALDVPNRVVYFGLNTPVGDQKPRDFRRAALHPLRNGVPVSLLYYAHLGDFVCPKCGYHRQNQILPVQSIDRMEADGEQSDDEFRRGDKACRDQGCPQSTTLQCRGSDRGVCDIWRRAVGDHPLAEGVCTARSDMEKFELPREDYDEGGERQSGGSRGRNGRRNERRRPGAHDSGEESCGLQPRPSRICAASRRIFSW